MSDGDEPISYADARRLGPPGFGLLNWVASRWFYWWRRSPGLRFSIELVGGLVIISGVAGLWFDYNDRADERVKAQEERDARELDRQVAAEEREARAEERLARMWDLATDPRPGNSGKIPALEFLNREKHPLTRIEIKGAFLNGIQLSNADMIGANLEEALLIGAMLNNTNLSGANLSRAHLSGADLTEVSLFGATLTSARMREVNLTDAYLGFAKLQDATLVNANFKGTTLTSADLSGADLSAAQNLTQSQIDSACQTVGGKSPTLPDTLTWHGEVCSEF